MALGGRESRVISLILRTASLSIRQAKNKSYWHSPHQSLWCILGMGSRCEFCCVNARQTHWGKDWSHISVIYSRDHFVLVIFLHPLRLKGEGTAQRSIEPNKLTACNEVRGGKKGRGGGGEWEMTGESVQEKTKQAHLSEWTIKCGEKPNYLVIKMWPSDLVPNAALNPLLSPLFLMQYLTDCWVEVHLKHHNRCRFLKGQITSDKIGHPIVL